MKCPICESESGVLFCSDNKRDYFRCNVCRLIYVSQKDFISPAEEKERYNFHNNTLDNKDYVTYLRSVVDELRRIPVTNPVVLDFGSGEHSVLTCILQEQGIACTAYDPLHALSPSLPERNFDIVILCEVIEHLRDIQREAALINKVLKPEGYILIRTELYSEQDDFVNWWYTKDCTHINFYSLPAIQNLSKLLGKKIFYTNEKNVVILKHNIE